MQVSWYGSTLLAILNCWLRTHMRLGWEAVSQVLGERSFWQVGNPKKSSILLFWCHLRDLKVLDGGGIIWRPLCAIISGTANSILWATVNCLPTGGVVSVHCLYGGQSVFR